MNWGEFVNLARQAQEHLERTGDCYGCPAAVPCLVGEVDAGSILCELPRLMKEFGVER